MAPVTGLGCSMTLSARPSSIATPDRTSPKPTAKSNASTAPWPKNGPTPRRTAATKTVPPPTPTGSISIITTDPTPASEASHPHNVFATSRGITVRLPMYRTIAVTLTLAALTAILVSTTSGAGYGTLLITLTAAGFFIPAAVGPTRNVLTVEAYPADLKGTGLGVMELYARLGSAGLGAAGGVVAGAGIGLGAFFLVLLVPLGILGGSLGVLKHSQRRKTKQRRTEEKTLVNSMT